MNVGRVCALGLGLSVLATLAGVSAATAEGVSLICAFSSGNNLLASYDYVEIDPDIDTLVLVATQDATAAPIEYGSKESPPSRLSVSQGVEQFVGVALERATQFHSSTAKAFSRSPQSGPMKSVSQSGIADRHSRALPL